MRQRLFSIVLCFLFAFALPLYADAVFYSEQGTIQYIADQADVFSDQEHIELEGAAQMLSESYGCDILIAVVNDLDGYSAGDYASILNSGHWWDSDNAALFLLAMEEREWYIATFGDAIYIFTDYGIDILGDAVVPYLSEGRYYDGFSSYFNMLPEYFQAWQDSVPIDDYAYDPGPRDEVSYYTTVQRKSFWSVLPVSLLIGVAVATISIIAMRSSMNTRRRQRSAGDYLKVGSYQLHTHQDIFLYSNVSKTRRQENTGGSGGHHGGGSSIHRSSGGRSHGGRGRRF